MESLRLTMIAAIERMKLLPLWGLLWLSYFVVYRFILLRPYLNEFSSNVVLALDQAVPRAFLFDGVVIGFLLMPLWALCFLPKSWGDVLQRLIIVLTYGTCAVVTTFDLLQYSRTGRRFREPEWARVALEGWWQSAPREVWGNLILLAFSLGVALYIFRVKVKKSPRRLMWIEVIFRHLLVMVLLIILARGSFSQHHLRREDALVSEHSPLVEWIYNSMWVFDKVD